MFGKAGLQFSGVIENVPEGGGISKLIFIVNLWGALPVTTFYIILSHINTKYSILRIKMNKKNLKICHHILNFTVDYVQIPKLLGKFTNELFAWNFNIIMNCQHFQTIKSFLFHFVIIYKFAFELFDGIKQYINLAYGGGGKSTILSRNNTPDAVSSALHYGFSTPITISIIFYFHSLTTVT